MNIVIRLSRTILEHFKSGLLQCEEAFSDGGDALVEVGCSAAIYCDAQWLRHGRNPAMEEATLLLEVVLLLCNKVPHDVAERRYMVFRLARFGPSRETEARKLP